MNVGDPIKVTGTVKEIVADSVMMQSDDQPSNPGREIWFKQTDVQPNPPVTTTAEAGPAHPVAAAEAAVAHPGAAVAHQTPPRSNR